MSNIETKEELEIIKDVENGKYTSLEKNDFDNLKKSLQSASKKKIKELSKRKAISIRLLESDIKRLKAMALNEGMPYQTYISTMIHKLTTGRLVEI